MKKLILLILLTSCASRKIDIIADWYIVKCKSNHIELQYIESTRIHNGDTIMLIRKK